MEFTQTQLNLILQAVEYYRENMQLDDFDSFEEFDQVQEQLDIIINVI